MSMSRRNLFQNSSLAEAAVAVLGTADPQDKARIGRVAAASWQAGELVLAPPAAIPERPARPARPELRAPRDMPRRRKFGSRKSRIALLHAVAHIELNAIDLAWDLIARFAADLPRAFADDWVRVADDEARHFGLLDARLNELDAAYGDLPAHDGLWDSATRTAHDPAARLAVVPMVLEARGLDVTPGMISRLEAAGDSVSAGVLETILEEEVTHVAAGRRWFEHLCRLRGEPPAQAFHTFVERHFSGLLKPPFNADARGRAGLVPDFYEPLAEITGKTS